MMAGTWQWAAGNRQPIDLGGSRMPTLAMTAFPRHTTATSDKAWDGPANETHVRTGEADTYYRRIYAWADNGAQQGTKAAYRFIHHQVGGDGAPQAASIRACISGIAVLNGGRGGTTIPDADRGRVYAHLAGHLRDAGVEPPELKAAADVAQMTGTILTATIEGVEYAIDDAGDWSIIDDDAPVDDTVVASVESATLIAWSGILCVEGKPTGDNRMFMDGSLEWDDEHMPFDLFAMLKDPDGGQGHAGAEVCGRIDEIWREPSGEPGVNFIKGRGVYDTSLAAGAEVVRLQHQRMMKGVSVDVDKIEVDMTDVDDDMGGILRKMLGGGIDKFAHGRIRRATVCSIPAFIEATISPDDMAVTAGAAIPVEVSVFTAWADGDPLTLVASAGERFTSELLEKPPATVFARKAYDGYTPCTVDPDGLVTGHVLPWGECHIGFTDRCVLVAGSDNAYRYARTGHTETREGDLVATARIYAQFTPGRRGHADERLSAKDAVTWYEDMTRVMADVAVYDDEYGMQVQGRVRPGVDTLDLIAFRASDFSPDWRGINGRREMVAIAAVNVSGFPSRYDTLPALVASAADAGLDASPVPILSEGITGTAWAVDGEIITLVASAYNLHGPQADTTALANRVAELEAMVQYLHDRDLERDLAAALDGVDLDDFEAELHAQAAEALAGLDDGEFEGNDTGRRRCVGCGALMSPDESAKSCSDCLAKAAVVTDAYTNRPGVSTAGFTFNLVLGENATPESVTAAVQAVLQGGGTVAAELVGDGTGEALPECSCDGACAGHDTAELYVKPKKGVNPFPKKGDKKDDGEDDPKDDGDNPDDEGDDEEDPKDGKKKKPKGRPFTADDGEVGDSAPFPDELDGELGGTRHDPATGRWAPGSGGGKGGAPKMPKKPVSVGAGKGKDDTKRVGMKGPRDPSSIDWDKRKREGKTPAIRPVAGKGAPKTDRRAMDPANPNSSGRRYPAPRVFPKAR